MMINLKTIAVTLLLTISLTGCSVMAVGGAVVKTGVGIATTGVKLAAKGVGAGVKAVANAGDDDKEDEKDSDN